MSASIKFARTALGVLTAVAGISQVCAQALPAATAPTPYEGFALPSVGGTLRYSLSASESVIFGYNGQPGTGANAYTNVSGNLAYLSRSETHPFSAVYSGGYLFGNSNEPSYPYQDLALSQAFHAKSWDFVVADAVDYLPQTPITGLSGIPGVGDLGLPPVEVGPTTGIGILTNYSSRVNNTVSGTASRKLTASTSVSGTGSYSIQRYTDDSPLAINNDSVSGSGTLNHRIDALSSGGASYSYSTSSLTLGETTFGYETQSFTGNYSRQLSRQVSMNVSAGPQRVANSGATTLLSAPSWNVTASAGLSYAGQIYNSALTYARGVNNGNGVVVGSRYDTVALNTARRLGRLWNIAGTVGYNRSSQLPNSTLLGFTSSGVVAGGQISWQVHPSVTTFASYTLQRQDFSGTTPALNAFNGISQVASFGVTYSPRPLFQRR